ncbi:MAG: HlyD family efflux transporter periplasmic adaptor subunit [Anaerolineae bacterium]|nr:HlyD family efflux transporter periplasmic adaptor subunit [Anaerolineae bacterium]
MEQSEAALLGAEQYLAELYRQRANPLDLQAQVNAAKAQYEVASAAVALAHAQVEGLKMGATQEQVAAADAQVEVARSALAALQVHLDRLSLKAPISGLILERLLHVGEVAMPGASLLTLADLGDVSLTIYVPEDQVGKVQLGQPVSVTVDAYPGRVFTGEVAFISSQAEFTPKNVQTKEERVSMVFAVKVELPNPDLALKPGMPADAILSETVR